jgi:perosamine synthetase
MIPIYKPWVCNYKRAKEALDSGWISSQGTFIKEAEEAMIKYNNWKNFILLNNGTTATHCIYLALKEFHPEIKTIYVPNNVYVAVWNCALMVYPKSALKVMPISDDLCIPTDEEFLRSLEPNSAIVIVHNVGNIIDVDKIVKVRPDIILIEDMCEGLFGKYINGNYVGSHPNILCSSVSFFANKNITCGEGGGIATEHNNVACFIRRIINQGNTNKRYIHDIHAYNYRPTNIQAAILLDQLDCIEDILENKKIIFERYINVFKDIESISLPRTFTNANWMFCLQIKNNTNFEKIETYFKEKNIDIRPFFYDIHKHCHLADVEKIYNNSNNLEKEVFILPAYPHLSYEEQLHIIDTTKNYINIL